jgi:hypothetical protein
MTPFDPDPSSADLERRLEEYLRPVAPPQHVRAALLSAPLPAPVAVRPLWARVAAVLLPYAAGVATVLLVRVPEAPPAPPPLSYEAVADRLPAAPPPPPEVPAPSFDPLPLPVPRIS